MKKIGLIGLLCLLLASFDLHSIEPQKGAAGFAQLPVDIQALISRELIEVDPSLKPNDLTDFYKSINNITNYARVNSKFRSAINNPDTMIGLVQTLVERFKNKSTENGVDIDEIFIAKGLANMPGIKSERFQNWLKPIVRQKEFNKAVSELNVEKVKELIAQGVNVNARDANGYTPILLATMHQNIPLMQEIVKYNPNLNLADSFGQTPFHFAAASPNRQIMDILLAYVRKNNIALRPEINNMVEQYTSQ